MSNNIILTSDLSTEKLTAFYAAVESGAIEQVNQIQKIYILSTEVRSLAVLKSVKSGQSAVMMALLNGAPVKEGVLLCESVWGERGAHILCKNVDHESFDWTGLSFFQRLFSWFVSADIER